MKRKSTLILIAALVLAVTIPAFAMAAGGNGALSDDAVQALDGTGNMYGQSNEVTGGQGTRLMLQDPELVDEDCDGEGLGIGADGTVQRQNARTESGQRMLLENGSGENCEDCENCDGEEPEYQNRRDLSEGFRGRHQVD